MTFSRVVWLASVVFCGVLPLITLIALFASAISDDTVAFDFRPFYEAAGALLRGENPFPSADDPLTASSGAYVYPPLTAIGVIPLRVLPLEAAGLLLMALLAAVALAIPLVLGVRDWRCYGIVLLWPPVLSAIQTGNLTLLLGLAAALTWRFRDRPLSSSAFVGVTLAAKLFLWPLVVWLAATRRLVAAGLACVIGIGLLFLSWAAIGFAGLGDYVDLMRRLAASVGSDAYTAHVVALDLGASPTVARAIWLILGLAVLAAVVVVGRRGDECSAFILAIAAAVALTPIVWLHYFALLIVVVALAQPRLALAWFVPLAMVVSPGSGNPTLFETCATLAAAALTIALALRASVQGVGPVGSDPEVSQSVSALRPASVAGLVRARAWVLALWVAMLGWVLVVFGIVRDHYLDYRLARFDLGNMVQAVWSTAHGRPLEITNGATGEQMIRLGGHVDPILAALAPLWIVAPTPLTLVAVQIAAVALGALPVFWLARRHLDSERAAGLLALTYLVYPWTAWTAVDVFHPVTLAIPLFLYCVWFLDTDRLLPFALCAVLAFTTGELMALSIAALGIWYALARGRRWTGFVIAVVSAGWTFVALYVVVPAFSRGASVFYGAFHEVGGSPLGVARTAFTDPGAILSAVSRSSDLLYLFLLAAPLGGAFLLAPGLAAVALPQLSVNLLAGSSATTDPHAHYVAGIVPFLFAAIALGLGRLSPTGRVRGAVLVLTLSLAATIVVGPWPGALGGAPTWYRMDTSPEYISTLRHAVELVPADAPVSSTNRVGSHLAARRYVYTVPVVGRAEWIVLESSDAWIPQDVGGFSDPEALRAFQDRIEESPEWRKVFEQSGVYVFRKVRT